MRANEATRLKVGPGLGQRRRGLGLVRPPRPGAFPRGSLSCCGLSNGPVPPQSPPGAARLPVSKSFGARLANAAPLISSNSIFRGLGRVGYPRRGTAEALALSRPRDVDAVPVGGSSRNSSVAGPGPHCPFLRPNDLPSLTSRRPTPLLSTPGASGAGSGPPYS
jgi:hypothetical protein